MAAPISKGPRIALIYDKNHLDPNERAITQKLSHLDPEKKIVFFAENRCLEDESLNQYSLELLSKDKNISTANSCTLLIAHIYAGMNPLALKIILSTIYNDPYLKKLFTEGHYSKYSPQNYGLDVNKPWRMLSPENITPRQHKTIANVVGLFQVLDQNLSSLPFHKREDFFEGHLSVATEAMTGQKGNENGFDYTIFARISEALAFIKIKQVNSKLSSEADKSKELPLSMINQLYGDGQSVGDLLNELNLTFRTQFQVTKVIKTIEKILKKPNQDPNTIFVVRAGLAHGEKMTSQLREHFKNGDIKEMSLAAEDLSRVEQKIQGQF
jgi:hypothetical protein